MTSPGTSRAANSRSSPGTCANWVCIQIEYGLDQGLVARGAHQALFRALAHQQPQRLGEQGLAGTGLPRQRGEAVTELEGGVLDEHEVADRERREHRFSAA